MMTEKEALDQLKIDIAQIKQSAWASMTQLSRATEDELRCAGHRTRESAVLWSLNDANVRCEKLTTIFERAFSL